MSRRDGRVPEGDLAIGRGANHILSFVQPEILSLLVAGQSHEPTHDRRATSLGNKHGSRRREFRGSFIGEIAGYVQTRFCQRRRPAQDRKSTRLNSSHVAISYAVFCLKKKKKNKNLLIIKKKKKQTKTIK